MKRKRFSRGYVQVYTGDGKGKTTAALGLALQASGHGLRTYVGQFIKGQRYGELEALRDNQHITLEQYGDVHHAVRLLLCLALDLDPRVYWRFRFDLGSLS
jgi:ATP:corrinoid adenosyltransferase